MYKPRRYPLDALDRAKAEQEAYDAQRKKRNLLAAQKLHEEYLKRQQSEAYAESQVSVKKPREDEFVPRSFHSVLERERWDRPAYPGTDDREDTN